MYSSKQFALNLYLRFQFLKNSFSVDIHCNFVTKLRTRLFLTIKPTHEDEAIKMIFCFRDNLYQHITFLRIEVIRDCDT